MKTQTPPTILHSSGPDVDPFSMYCTTNSQFHDVKVPLKPVPRNITKEMGGFARNNQPTKAKEAPDVPNPKTLGKKYNALIDNPNAPVHFQSVTAAAFNPSSTLLGERADQEADEVDADLVAAIAAHRHKRHGTGFATNHKGSRPTTYFEPQKELSALEKARLGNRDPVAKENNYRGPSNMSTTNRASYVPHQESEELESGILDVNQPRFHMNGAVRNMQPTLLFQEHDGWQPSTEYRDRFMKTRTAEEDAPPLYSPANAQAERNRQPFRSARSREGMAFRDLLHKTPDLRSTFPTKLTQLQEQTMRTKDPIEWELYQTQDPWQTTSGSAHCRKPHAIGNGTAVSKVLNENETIQKMVDTQDPQLTASVYQAMKMMAGGPNNNKSTGSGYAKNNHGVNDFNETKKLQQAGLAPPTPAQEQEMSTTYRGHFVNQMKIPVSSKNVVALKKSSTGFQKGNGSGMFEQ